MTRSMVLPVVLLGTAGTLLIGLLNTSLIQGQSQPTSVATLAFEVASIKPSQATDPGRPHGGICNGVDHPVTGGPVVPGVGRCVFVGATLRTIINRVYGVDRIVGGPDWAYSDEFEIQSKAENTATTTRDQLLQMFQRLLADRFKLKLRREMTEVSGYGLVIANHGPRLKEISSSEKLEGATGRPGRFVGQATIPEIARSLSMQLRSPITDNTGLLGRYNIVLTWTADIGPGPIAESEGPSLFTALQEQLGLRLESRRVPVEVIVIEYAEKPVDN